MKRSAPALSAVLLAFLSGIPALVYQVVWSRQVGLLAGGQIGAISVVLVAFFGGLALGTRIFGAISDRASSPRRLYGVLEIGAGVFAATTILTFQMLGDHANRSDLELLTVSAIFILPSTILLGGALPALLRSASIQPDAAPRHAGWLVGVNTIGSVLGVGLAIYSIPLFGLRASLLYASAGSIGIGLVAVLTSRSQTTSSIDRSESGSLDSTSTGFRAPPVVLAAAFFVGAATLGFEVLATRLATLRLGSSLYAWGLVLSLFLLGLGAGNLVFARRAKTATRPERDLGWIEISAACSVALGLAILRPSLAVPTSTLTTTNMIRIAIAVLPAAFFMGAAFPILVRLAVQRKEISTEFGRLSAANTIGGIAGSLIGAFALLPMLGTITAGFIFAAINAVVGLIFLGRESSARPAWTLPAATFVLVVACLPIFRPRELSSNDWVLFVDEGKQATAVVTSSWGNRTLIVDGDPEASTAGNARRTEELLAVLPLILHPSPHRFLEVGLGSGITLGTAGHFELERLECVEIALSVIRAARFFEPINQGVATDGQIKIIHADARRLLLETPNTYDIISANTLHPWSVGATGLYSREYFSRMAAALRSGGIVVQWLPTQQISSESMSLILRTFFDIFPEGSLWWGAGNIIAIGSQSKIPRYDPERADRRLTEANLSWSQLGWKNSNDVESHQIADAAAVRLALQPGELLYDDRPRLESNATRRRDDLRTANLYKTLASIAQHNVGDGAMLFWLESLERRAAGDDSGADAREGLASNLGLRIAGRARLSRLVATAHQKLASGDADEAFATFSDVLSKDATHRYALFGRAGLEIRRGNASAAIRDLETITSTWPDDVRAWNELAGVLAGLGRLDDATNAIEQALVSNPFDLRALANAGLIAMEMHDPDRARIMLGRMQDVSPMGRSVEEESLADTIERS